MSDIKTVTKKVTDECLRYIRMHKKMPLSVGLTKSQFEEYKHEVRQTGEKALVMYKGKEHEVPVGIM